MEEKILNNLTSLILALTCGVCGTTCAVPNSADFSANVPAIVCEQCAQPASTQIDAATSLDLIGNGNGNTTSTGNSNAFDINSLLDLIGQNGNVPTSNDGNATSTGNSNSFDMSSLLELIGQNGNGNGNTTSTGNSNSFDINSLLNLIGQNGNVSTSNGGDTTSTGIPNSFDMNSLLDLIGNGNGNNPTQNTSPNNSDSQNTSPTNNTPTGTNIPASELSDVHEVIALTNKARAEAGLSALKTAPLLNEMAGVRAAETVQSFGHPRPDGRSCFTIYDDYGVKYRAVAENIACGQRSPEEVVNAWLNSSGHRANIMSSAYNYIGVGLVYDSSTVYGYYWAQIFYTPISGTLDGEYFAENAGNIATEPVSEPVTEPIIEPVNPFTEPIEEPTTPATEPITEPANPATEPIIEPTNPVTEPIIEPTNPVKIYGGDDLINQKRYLHAVNCEQATDTDGNKKIDGIDLAILKFVLLNSK
jgi:uncharacterized protein YkwD